MPACLVVAGLAERWRNSMMQQREWVQVYEGATDESGFEHVNPNIVFSAGIESIEDELVNVAVTNTDNNVRIFQFTDVKEAQRFIRRLSIVE